MLEEYYVLMTCIPIEKQCFIEFVKAVFILLPDASCAAVYVYMYIT